MDAWWNGPQGTPQGGVVSRCSNLFFHYAFNVWMTRTFPEASWCRYADDGLVHCNSEKEEVSDQGCARSTTCGMRPDYSSR